MVEAGEACLPRDVEILVCERESDKMERIGAPGCFRMVMGERVKEWCRRTKNVS